MILYNDDNSTSSHETLYWHTILLEKQLREAEAGSIWIYELEMLKLLSCFVPVDYVDTYTASIYELDYETKIINKLFHGPPYLLALFTRNKSKANIFAARPTISSYKCFADFC